MNQVYEDITGRQFIYAGEWWFSRDLDSGWVAARSWLRASPDYNKTIAGRFDRGELTPIDE